ncbi:unnamed protein product [Arabidopsis thaliana]|jgi:U4/U6.U5 tri-snRNP-associated protein 1|uniref:At3g14700 n=3 Tax=Arabidopsis TaxID=3701 RepID=Q84VW3_ARATH|nr:SART-1 family [Arabidopsis thaliana]NP_188088.1 SART-1 family [Arabidopsis thaliana]KAG7631256.1 SNU66/SART1 family [Arabidopsis suecica]AAO44041.1 At3g14700 [Arabidopsis thaliana]AEE75557.1 SART-1 family [Arabidopsis thaliana]ANM65078.1 SART-1 family [Arabidopsis thaliana]CAD5323080.1 unnamed protein product [Arabidopsis thaliana]|eukprot:NP_001319553.1 SART-1 family [Arabidopsis thaliana]
MSQSKVAMKKDSMRKNKKLVINIALDKEVLASRVEADHDLGSVRDEKERLESSERRREVCSKAEDIVDKAIDNHSRVRGDGIMREADVGTGLSGALNRLREQGTFKEEGKVVGVKDNNHEDDRFKDRFKDIQIQRVNKWGRIMTEKEAYRSLCHGFHGKGPGKKKQEKQRKKHEDKSKQMESSERSVERIREIHAISKTPYIVL